VGRVAELGSLGLIALKKFLIALGALFLALVVLGGIGIALVAIRSTALDKESKAYADSAIPEIASQWSEKALLDRAAPEFKQAVTIDHLDGMFRWFSRLGQLQKLDPVQGESNISLTPQTGKVVSALYTSKAYFENADATITLGLIKHGEPWQISRFEVQSPYLASP
jgi:hypothetical protein